MKGEAEGIICLHISSHHDAGTTGLVWGPFVALKQQLDSANLIHVIKCYILETFSLA